ncbi:MAG: hypothetical protein ABSA63_06180 [Thermoplasmata archaeon]|jgi:hypothetical protein
MSVKWRIKGGVTAVAGFVLVGLGAASTFVALGVAGEFESRIESTWLPGSPLVALYALALLICAVAVAGIGALLIGYARGERDREEALLLDPLSYPPVRHPWRRVLPWFALVVAVLVIPGLAVVPYSHSYSTELVVSLCSAGPYISVEYLNLPSGAVLSFQWASSDGRPVSEVYAPSGPPVGSTYALPNLFFNSTWGYSVVQSHGNPIPFWACDISSSLGPTNRTVTLTGTYYAEIL